jgi:hypothetical protein
LVQKSGDAIILDTLLADVSTDEKSPDPPMAQQLPLAFRDILIQDDHRAGSVSS